MTLEQPIDPHSNPRHFRDVLGHFGSGIVVVTAISDGAPVGFTCQSFSSVSLDPPLVTFIPAKTSTSYPRIRQAGRFGINILSLDQAELCRQMARSGPDKWNGVEWAVSAGGSPILASSHAFLDCVFETEYEAGDHFIVLGRVTALSAEPESAPLLFHRGAYSRLNA